NYESVAKVISENVDPQQDIFFSQGPMDVLDHSCSKFAFGGKMCVDATVKFPEEVRGMKAEVKSEFTVSSLQFTVSKNFPEINGINTSLLEKGISVVFISIEKNRKNHIRELNE